LSVLCHSFLLMTPFAGIEAQQSMGPLHIEPWQRRGGLSG
jgi:hypothetical protein